MPGGPPQTGMSLGPYHLVQCLASEGGAEVYCARANTPDGSSHEVALKVLLGALGDQASLFEHLARAMGPALACRHEAIVRTLELRTIDEVMVVATELVDGVDLGSLRAALSDQQHRLSTGVTLHVARGLLAGLDHFHSLRGADGRALPVVHGNLHPGNVLLSCAGQVKISDFIISLAVDASPGVVGCGRAGLYRSPEQATGDAVDHRTDIFAVGLLLYECLAGQQAYDPQELEDPVELEAVVCEADIIPLDEQAPELPPDLAQVIHGALEPDPSRRYASARAMLTALEPFLRLPEVATAGAALAGLVTQVTPRVMAARRIALAARAHQTSQQAAAGGEVSRPALVPGLPPPVVSPAPIPQPPAVSPTPMSQPPLEVMAARGQPQTWDTAVLPPSPDASPANASGPEPAASERHTVVMAAVVAEGERDGTDILEHTELMRLLRDKDQQRTVAGKEQVRECTLFWSSDEDCFVVEPESHTQLFAWSADGGRVEVALTPHQGTAPTNIKQKTETRLPRPTSPLRLASLLVAVSLAGLGLGAGVSRLLTPAPDTPGRVLEASVATPVQVGPWSLRLETAAVQPQTTGALKISVQLTHRQGRRPEGGRFFSLGRLGARERPDFWTARPTGERSVALALVFKSRGAGPLLLGFAPPGMEPVLLGLEAIGAEKRP